MTRRKNGSYFWIIIIVIAALIFGMIYFMSDIQAKEDRETEKLENKLSEQISTTKGFKASVQQITTENESLKVKLGEKEDEIINLYKKNDILTSFSEVLTLYINQTNNERIKVLIPTIDRNQLTTEQQALLDTIIAELDEESEIKE